MATSRSAGQDETRLGFTSIEDIINGKQRLGSRVNIAGIVTDFRAPIATRGADWKCQMRVYDLSVQDEPDAAVLLNIFRPQNEMPDARCGDVVVVLAAKVQRYQSSYSLFTHRTTDISVFDAARIPEPYTDASEALRPLARSVTYRRLNRAENRFVSILYGTINKERLPTASEFEIWKINSTNVKKKFSELKDVEDGKFVDTVAHIVKEPYDLGDKITLWVSDYTENPLFYQHQLMGGKGQESDPFGYTTIRSDASASTSAWSGPLGRRSMQITCFEPHASVIRDQKLTQGAWVFLRNLQIKYGHSMANLEGFLREERSAQGIKINIFAEVDSPLQHARIEVKNALQRKVDYERTRKAQINELTEAATAGAKRRAELSLDGQPALKMNSRARRKMERAQKAQACKEQEGRNIEAQSPKNLPGDRPAELNPHVKCENGNNPSTLMADILAPVQHKAMINGESTRLPLPFINANYRTFVRVIDFLPAKLEDFARPKKGSKKAPAECAAVADSEESDSSDNGDLDSDSESDAASESDDKSESIKEWEWRFYLRLEQAGGPEESKPKKSLWALVDNQSAQMLLGLDATDLHHDDANLGRLRQKMFILWGDLEEHKAQLENRALQARPFHNGGPPADSDEEAAPVKQETVPVQAVSNVPFGCCIRQYGVKLHSGNDGKGDGGSVCWQRMFGLFGTRISEV